MRNAKLVRAVGAVGALALSCGSAFAQNVHISRLYEQILENIEFTDTGYALDSFGVIRLYGGETARIDLDVPSGTPIEIMGDCDEDCYDLDLIVYDEDGNLIAEDRYDDYYPIVSFTSGDYNRVTLELDLIDCGTAFCYSAYSVFIGPRT